MTTVQQDITQEDIVALRSMSKRARLLLFAISSSNTTTALLKRSRLIHPISLFQSLEMSTIQIYAYMSAVSEECLQGDSLPADSSLDNEKS